MASSECSPRIAVTRQSSYIMVHLPFDQHTKVALQSGFTVKDKVGQKLCYRMVPLEACCVREKRKSGEERVVNWNEELSQLSAESELTVVLSQPKMLSFQHQIIRQGTISLSMTFCNVCTKRIYVHGFRCQLCDIVFHQKCGSNIPTICFPVEKCSEDAVKRKNGIIPEYGIRPSANYQCFVGPKTKGKSETLHGNKINLVTQDNEHFHKRDGLDSWQLRDGSVIKNCRIGAGTFGYVYKGVWYGDVAIKTAKTGGNTEEGVQALMNEFEILKTIRHVNILTLKGFLREPRLGIVIQWCDNLSLYKHLHVNEPPTKFSCCEINTISKQIAQGMAYLHSKDILHRDLKTNNIFLTDDMTVKIGDFGLATTKSLCNKTNQCQLSGSILWMAPEVIRMQDETPYTCASDVYSFGIVLYELGSCSLPYSHINNRDQILFMVGRGLLKPDFTKIRPDVSCSFKNLMQKCTDFDRDNRPDFKMILNVLTNLNVPKIDRSSSVLLTNDVENEHYKNVCENKKESLQVHSNGSVLPGRHRIETFKSEPKNNRRSD